MGGRGEAHQILKVLHHQWLVSSHIYSSLHCSLALWLGLANERHWQEIREREGVKVRYASHTLYFNWYMQQG